MSKTDNLQKLGMFLLLWLVVISGKEACAQRRGPSSEQIFGYLDSNKNGRIDPEEVEKSRGPFKEMLKKAGVDYRKGLDQKTFSKAFEKIRIQKEAESANRDRGDNDRRRREEYERRKKEYEKRRKVEEESKKRESSKKSSKKSVPVIKPKPRATVDMPKTFTEGDRDTDGQIGFYEWKKWKRDSISDFLKYDHNHDGFLTPRELAKGPVEIVANTSITETMAPIANSATNANSATKATPIKSPAVKTLETTSPSSAKSALSKVTVGTNSVVESSVAGRRAVSMFRLLDKDKDDLLSGDEWNRSRTIKPLFEKGGIDLSKPMPKDDFIANYVRLSES